MLKNLEYNTLNVLNIMPEIKKRQNKLRDLNTGLSHTLDTKETKYQVQLRRFYNKHV